MTARSFSPGCRGRTCPVSHPSGGAELQNVCCAERLVLSPLRFQAFWSEVSSYTLLSGSSAFVGSCFRTGPSPPPHECRKYLPESVTLQEENDNQRSTFHVSQDSFSLDGFLNPSSLPGSSGTCRHSTCCVRLSLEIDQTITPPGNSLASAPVPTAWCVCMATP